MASVIFGTDLGALTPIETRAYLAGMSKSELQKRLAALSQLMNVQRVYLYHGNEQKSFTVKTYKRELTRESRKASKEGMVE
jgi:anthranilate phosphoribosyltransferase